MSSAQLGRSSCTIVRGSHERRLSTDRVQVLLAIATGAKLVTPDWLTASMEAGDWLPEEPYLAQVSPAAVLVNQCLGCYTKLRLLCMTGLIEPRL